VLEPIHEEEGARVFRILGGATPPPPDPPLTPPQ